MVATSRTEKGDHVPIVDFRSHAEPAWYELGLRSIEGLTIRVPTPGWNWIQRMFPPAPAEILNERGQPAMTLPPFTRPRRPRWGYDRTIISSTISGQDATTLFIPWPRPKRQPAEFDWPLMLGVSKELGLLWTTLAAWENPVTLNRPQLLDVRGWSTEIGFYGAALEVQVAGVLAEWITAHLDRTAQEEVASIMRRVHNRMWPERATEAPPHEFLVMVDDQGLHLMCPGNACDLCPDQMMRHAGLSGYRLVPHNTDSPLQQLTLLAGLAAISDMFRRHTGGEQ